MNLFFLTLLVGGGLATVSANDCWYPNCFDINNVFYDGPFLPETRTDLTTYCKANLPYLECELNSTLTCNDTEPWFTGEVQLEFFKKICTNDTDLGIRFLSHTHCLNHHEQSIFWNSTYLDTLNDQTDRDCEKHLHAAEILYDNIEKYCDSNAASVFREAYNLKELCGDKETTKETTKEENETTKEENETTKEENVLTTESSKEQGSLDAEIKLRAKLPSLRWLVKGHANISVKTY